jgi:hypothetical protein
MATKKQKKQRAKKEIDLLPDAPPLPGPFRLARPIVRGAKFLAKELVDADPLGIITEDQVIESMINEPSFKLSSDQVDLINNDRRMVARVNGEMVEVPAAMIQGMPRSRQFERQNILPRRTRKKTKTDKNMSKALREANNRLRTKNGKLRKGKTQGDVMRLAHRLRRKMK